MLERCGNNSHFVLSLALLTLSLSLFEQLLFWVLLLVICAVAMRLALFASLHKHLPSVRTINLLAVLSAIALAYYGIQLGLLLSMVNLLVMAAALKLMLMRREKEFYQLITAMIFMIACGFIFHQGMALTLLYTVITVALLMSLAFHIAPSQSWSTQTKLLLRLCAQSLPIALLFFLVLPQIKPLWQMPTANSGETGLSDTVTPGDIAQLSQSSELAFRATFDGQVPAPAERYWRAIVLESFDGETWQQSRIRKMSIRHHWLSKKRFIPDISGPRFSYEVIAEPSSQHWLFSLDIPRSSASEVWMSRDYRLQSRFPLMSQFKYSVDSYFQAPLVDGLMPLDKNLSLQLPREGNPRTREWVKELRPQHSDDINFARAVLTYFSEQDFAYTLKPPLMQDDSIDQFLFDYQRGFCAHYAGAFVYAMRLAGIPARMVNGYLGGELVGNYLSVYQYDAHAWAEIWQPDRGWLRVDPTVLVSPDRLNFGLQQAVAYEESFLSGSPFSLARFQQTLWLNQLRLWLADMDYLWSRWVLGFDQQKQLGLFKQILGELTPQRIAFMSMAVMMIIGGFLIAYHYRIWFPKIDEPALHYYQKALKTLAKNGIVRTETQGPEAFAQHVNKIAKSELATDFNRLTELFVAYKYAQREDLLMQLKLAVKQFQRLHR